MTGCAACQFGLIQEDSLLLMAGQAEPMYRLLVAGRQVVEMVFALGWSHRLMAVITVDGCLSAVLALVAFHTS